LTSPFPGPPLYENFYVSIDGFAMTLLGDCAALAGDMLLATIVPQDGMLGFLLNVCGGLTEPYLEFVT
jgi:hypothetical protein